MSSLSSSELAIELRKVGNKLLALASCVTTQVEELLQILDELEGLLSKVEQAPSRSMQDALYPSMKALISNQLLKHTDTDVKVSLASCMSELIRITAPDAPYDDAEMKDIFQLTVMAFGMLSNKDTRGYSKALHILDNIVKVKACLLMLDLECDGLIADMFKQFLSSIRYISLSVVFQQMEYIMTLTLEESEEIPEEFLSSLLSSVNKKKENALSRSWRLGESVLRNCAGKLQHFLPKLVRSRNLSFDDYSIVVASICENSPKDKHVVLTDSGIMTSRVLHIGFSKKEHDDSNRYIEKVILMRIENCCIYDITVSYLVSTLSEKGSGIPHGISVFGEKLVGRRIKVWWPLDKFFYEGAVASFDSVTQTHKVLYADGDEETLNLNNERWDLLEEPTMVILFCCYNCNGFSSVCPWPHTNNHFLSRSMKKKAKRKSASTEKQGTPSSSKWSSATHTKITENDKLPHEKLSEVGEIGMLPDSVDVECGGQSATHTKITEDDKLPREKPSEDGETGMLPDPVDELMHPEAI
ncbi:hypothetical protein DCAR_0518652 [Daucus carota subsp. sativus]|uniref:PTM/DIR17-like Tudor domain-containing protein n=1 Tax=Daucus carota subsp. sativus TaxID=79200 RepID=A0AAF0X1C5_DAUCS|nr:hypothetical protein DCAR_0518652 [Daucus carota subsp. sativus]